MWINFRLPNGVLGLLGVRDLFWEDEGSCKDDISGNNNLEMS